jgi:hypothetical protein
MSSGGGRLEDGFSLLQLVAFDTGPEGDSEHGNDLAAITVSHVPRRMSGHVAVLRHTRVETTKPGARAGPRGAA